MKKRTIRYKLGHFTVEGATNIANSFKSSLIHSPLDGYITSLITFIVNKKVTIVFTSLMLSSSKNCYVEYGSWHSLNNII